MMKHHKQGNISSGYDEFQSTFFVSYDETLLQYKDVIDPTVKFQSTFFVS